MEQDRRAGSAAQTLPSAWLLTASRSALRELTCQSQKQPLLLSVPNTLHVRAFYRHLIESSL